MTCVCVSQGCLLKHASHVSCNAAVLGANEVSSQSTRLLMFSHLCAIMAMGIRKRDLYWIWFCFGLPREWFCVLVRTGQHISASILGVRWLLHYI